MASKTQVKIFGKSYTVKGSDPDELQELADFVDSKMQELASATKAAPADLPVLAALNIAQDYFEMKQELEALKEEGDAEKGDMEDRISQLVESLDLGMKQLQETGPK